MPNLKCRLVPHTKLSCIVWKYYIFRVITLTRVNDNKIVILWWTLSLRTHITLHMSCYLLMHSYRSRMYVNHVSCPSFFFSLLSIYLHAQSINFMVHKVQNPDIVHKYSWKGCKAQPSEPCEQNNAPEGTSTLHLYIKSTLKMSLCKILGCRAHFLLAEVILMPKRQFFFFKCHSLRLTDTHVYSLERLIISLIIFYHFISFLRFCIIHRRIINFSRGSMEIYTVFSKTSLYVRKHLDMSYEGYPNNEFSTGH